MVSYWKPGNWKLCPNHLSSIHPSIHPFSGGCCWFSLVAKRRRRRGRRRRRSGEEQQVERKMFAAVKFLEEKNDYETECCCCFCWTDSFGEGLWWWRAAEAQDWIVKARKLSLGKTQDSPTGSSGRSRRRSIRRRRRRKRRSFTSLS